MSDRQIVQITSVTVRHRDDASDTIVLHALCDDGTIWQRYGSGVSIPWVEIKNGRILANLKGRTRPGELQTGNQDNWIGEAAHRARKRIAALEAIVIQHTMQESPCKVCGYKGPGYYQPDTHPCAKIWHAVSSGGEQP